jgi:hypothetical protein
MNAREEIHGLSRANVDMLERSAARAFLGCGISLLAGAPIPARNGPEKGAPAIVPAGMMGDRAAVIFAAPEEITSMIEPRC